MKIDRARMFDLRVVQRNIRSGRVNKDEYAAYLTALSDTSPKIKPREEGGDEDGYDGHPAPAAMHEPERMAAPPFASMGVAPEPFASSTGPDDDDDGEDDDDDDDIDEPDTEPASES